MYALQNFVFLFVLKLNAFRAMLRTRILRGHMAYTTDQISCANAYESELRTNETVNGRLWTVRTIGRV